MKILVTGGAGFIGSNLVAALVRDGGSVTVLDDLSTGFESNLEDCASSLRFVRGDVCDATLMSTLVGEADVVFHLAARVGNVRSFDAPIDDAQVNVIGTRNLLHAARNRPGISVVYSSSAAIFGESRYVPVDEDHQVLPDSPYGVSKLAAERDALCYGKAFGIRVVCLRYFNAYGRHQRFDAYGNVIPIFVERMHNGQELLVYGDGEQTRDFVNVKDVVAANLAALRTDARGVYNIGSGTPTTVNEVIAALGRCTSTPLRVRHVEPRVGEVRHSYSKIDRARDTLGYEPRVALEDGLRDYTAWVEMSKKSQRNT